MKFLKVLVFFIAFSAVSQDNGGMWIPSLLDGFNESEMQDMGMKMSAKDIYDVNNSSLKDAIAHFDGGCTSEVISNSGLLLTNHHCGYRRIQQHSSVEHDYLKDGFWAKELGDELANEGMSVTFINRIDDVTEAVFAGVTEGMDAKAKRDLMSQNIEKAQKNAEKEDTQKTYVRSFFKGNQYLLFVVEVFTDIRLVGAPPSSIGKYGKDTDNWMWPRHTGDFSLFRIYANKDNKPADYAADNIPYTPKHFLPISLDGVEEGDFSLIFGFPGRTNEYLPAVAIDQTVNVLNPAKIEIRANAIEIVDGFMRNDQAIKIQYASKFASVANYWKKWIGENTGIKKANAIVKKREFEKEFSKRVAAKDVDGYKSLLSDFESLYKEIEEVAVARDYWIEVAYRNVEMLKSSFRLYQLEQAYVKGGEAGFEKARTGTLKGFEKFYKDYSPLVDKPVFERLVNLYKNNVPAEFVPESVKNADITAVTNDIYANSKLVSLESAKDLLSGTPEEAIAKIRADKAFVFGKGFHEMFFNSINPKYGKINEKIAATQKTYMTALMELFPEKKFFPDANSTLRVSYGTIRSTEPRDGVTYKSKTYLEGVIAKYKPNDYEFDLPQKLIDLYDAKDYGPYAEANGKLPVCFLGTNHITGGNSGSPVIDAHGNLIGLAFDSSWEGTMSDMYYDVDIVRCISVDIRYVLFIMDKFAGADRLMNELKLVHPKK